MNVEMIQDQLGNAATFFESFGKVVKGLEFFYGGENPQGFFKTTFIDPFVNLSSNFGSSNGGEAEVPAELLPEAARPEAK